MRAPMSIHTTATTTGTSFSTYSLSIASYASVLASSSALLQDRRWVCTKTRAPRPGWEHCSVGKHLPLSMSRGNCTCPNTEGTSRRPLRIWIPSLSRKQDKMMPAKPTRNPQIQRATPTLLSAIVHCQASWQSPAQRREPPRWSFAIRTYPHCQTPKTERRVHV